jgi:RNA polymerase sigma-70 factor (ECF subfamily)
MSIDAQLHPTAAAAVRGDGVAVADIDRQLTSARDRNEFAAIEDVLAPIVDAAATGDAAAVSFLLRCIDRHQLTRGPIRRVLINEGDVDDATQNTLLQVHRAIGSFERRSRFTTWLYRIAEREALQVLRRNKRVAVPDDSDMSGLADEVRRMSSMVASQAMIRQILAEMDPKFREPVVLRDVEGLEYSTIAEQLGIPLNTVRTRISRGRQYVADRVTEQMRSGGSLG